MEVEFLEKRIKALKAFFFLIIKTRLPAYKEMPASNNFLSIFL